MREPLPAEFAAALDASADARRPFGEPVYYFPEIGSTNDVAAALAERGAPEGTLVLAAAQTAGRGRMGRTWFSPPGAGLYFSVVCRTPSALPLLTLGAGVAVADGIRTASGLAVELKWPNDVVLAGDPARRAKLAGVLTEACCGSEGLQHAVLGIGINVTPAAYPPDVWGATWLERELGRPVDAPLLLASCLVELARRIRQLEDGEGAAVLARWRTLAPSSIGAAIEWEGADGRLTGITAGLADDGALLVRTGDRLERIVSGELQWRPPTSTSTPGSA